MTQPDGPTTIFPPGMGMADMMAEAEELLDQLNDPATWEGRKPLCRPPFVQHAWIPRIVATVAWAGMFRDYKITYPVAIACRQCDWIIGLTPGDGDPLEQFPSRLAPRQRS